MGHGVEHVYIHGSVELLHNARHITMTKLVEAKDGLGIPVSPVEPLLKHCYGKRLGKEAIACIDLHALASIEITANNGMQLGINPVNAICCQVYKDVSHQLTLEQCMQSSLIANNNDSHITITPCSNY